jgi:hypothetical protein
VLRHLPVVWDVAKLLLVMDNAAAITDKRNALRIEKSPLEMMGIGEW